MASNTKMSWNKRFNKLNKAGKKRKRALEKNGSTKSEAALFGSVLPKSAR